MDSMNKLYGTKIEMRSAKGTTEFRHWYSTDKSVSDQLTESAKAIAPPANTFVEFTPIESDVIITARGTYELADGGTVTLNYESSTIMHGYQNVNGKPKINRPVAFYLNGEPSSRGTKAKGHRIVKLLRAYAC